MVAKKHSHRERSGFTPLPEERQRALRGMSFDDISRETFKEIWGEDLEKLLSDEDAQKKLPKRA